MLSNILTVVASLSVVTSSSINRHAHPSVISPLAMDCCGISASKSPLDTSPYALLSQVGTAQSQSPAISQSAFPTPSEPPFLRRPVLFDPNSAAVSTVGTKALNRAAVWLKEHADSRILIVGSCDRSGSEICTRGLAEARGGVIRKSLEAFGVASGQILGVKGWDNTEQGCRSSEPKCQQLGRSAQILLASPGSSSPESR